MKPKSKFQTVPKDWHKKVVNESAVITKEAWDSLKPKSNKGKVCEWRNFQEEPMSKIIEKCKVWKYHYYPKIIFHDIELLETHLRKTYKLKKYALKDGCPCGKHCKPVQVEIVVRDVK